MDDVRYAAMRKRIEALEARIVVLESAAIAPGGRGNRICSSDIR